MSDLVTPAVRDAALNAVFECDQGEDVRYAILRAVAPLIAAEALRQAADQLGRFEKESSRDGYVVAVSTAVSYLGGKADELERESHV